MASREQDSYAKLTATVEQVKTAFTSLQTERDEYKAALEGADADKAAAIQSALEQDSEHDADAIDAVNSALSQLVPGQQVEVPADSTGDTNDGDVPVEQADNTDTTPEF